MRKYGLNYYNACNQEYLKMLLTVFQKVISLHIQNYNTGIYEINCINYYDLKALHNYDKRPYCIIMKLIRNLKYFYHIEQNILI